MKQTDKKLVRIKKKKGDSTPVNKKYPNEYQIKKEKHSAKDVDQRFASESPENPTDKTAG